MDPHFLPCRVCDSKRQVYGSSFMLVSRKTHLAAAGIDAVFVDPKEKLPALLVENAVGGGNSKIFYFHPENWGKMNPF